MIDDNISGFFFGKTTWKILLGIAGRILGLIFEGLLGRSPGELGEYTRRIFHELSGGCILG